MFKAGTAMQNAGLEHTLAHAFGGALYEELGPAGFNYCKSDFSGGCYHEVIGRSMAEFGASETETFAKLCEEDATTTGTGHIDSIECFHALGHGILASYGYALPDLKKSLSLCDSITVSSASKASDLNCRIGAFMEYNIREILSGDTGSHFNPRPYSDDIKFKLCSEVDPTYGETCMFQLPYWWSVASNIKDPGARFQQFGEYCRSVDDNTLRERCFEGIGYDAPWLANFNETATIDLCKKAALTGTDVTSCLSEAAVTFYINHTPISKTFYAQFDPKGANPIEVGDFRT
jgi:hypothetical protein